MVWLLALVSICVMGEQVFFFLLFHASFKNGLRSCGEFDTPPRGLRFSVGVERVVFTEVNVRGEYSTNLLGPILAISFDS